MPMEPAMAVAAGGVLGVAGGVVFFRSVRALASRRSAEERGPAAIVWGIAWRLAMVAVVFGVIGYAGGRPGSLALLAGIILARIVVRRASGH